MTAHADLLEHFADVGKVCADQGVLPNAFDELAHRVDPRKWCCGESDDLGVCDTCGHRTPQAGHDPCAFHIPGFRAVLWARRIRRSVPRKATYFVRYFVLHRGLS